MRSLNSKDAKKILESVWESIFSLGLLLILFCISCAYTPQALSPMKSRDVQNKTLHPPLYQTKTFQQSSLVSWCIFLFIFVGINFKQ